jgi:hypothetical protein
MKISISKIYEKALSMFVVQKSMAILKRPAKASKYYSSNIAIIECNPAR